MDMTSRARHDPEGALPPPVSDPAWAGPPGQGRFIIPWVESSRDPRDVSVKARRALSVLFPTSHRGCELQMR